jgi:uracil phosphoribosyltransferase
MKKTLITILRNRNTSAEQYRQAADQLGTVLAVECDNLFPKATMAVSVKKIFIINDFFDIS